MRDNAHAVAGHLIVAVIATVVVFGAVMTARGARISPAPAAGALGVTARR